MRYYTTSPHIRLSGILITIFILMSTSPTTGHAQTNTYQPDPFTIGKRKIVGPPSLTIVQPQPQTTIFGYKVTIQLIPENILVTNPETHQKNVQGEGHVHIWIDSTPNEQDSIEYYTTEPISLEKIKPGNHTLTVEIVQNDHSSFSPPVKQSIQFQTQIENAPTVISKNSSSKTINPPSISISNIVFIIVAIVFVAIGGILFHIRS